MIQSGKSDVETEAPKNIRNRHDLELFGSIRQNCYNFHDFSPLTTLVKSRSAGYFNMYCAYYRPATRIWQSCLTVI